MSVERTERDTIAEIIAATLAGWDELAINGMTATYAASFLADALLGVFDITPRKKEEDAK